MRTAAPRRAGAGRLARAAISGVADQRMAEMGEMHPDLMGAAGLQTAMQQGAAPNLLQTTNMGLGGLGRQVLCAQNRHAQPVGGITPDGAIQGHRGAVGP